MSVQCVGERGRVVQPSSHLNRLGAQRGACFGRWFVSQGTCETCQEPHTERAVARRQAGERVAEERDEAKVVACPRPDDSAAIADGGLRKCFRHPAVACDLGCREEGVLGFGHVPGPRLGVAQGQQEVAARLVVRDERRFQSGDRHAVEARGFLVGEQPNRVSAGARCIFDCPLRITSRQRLEEVIRELADMRVGVVRIEILERLADSRVECDAATRAQLLVKGLADESV